MNKTKFFLDTEFNERGRHYPLELLSIGIVCENGRWLYLENVEADRKLCNDWVKNNVLNGMNTSIDIQEKVLSKIPFDTNGLAMREQEAVGDFEFRRTYNLMTIGEIADQIYTFVRQNCGTISKSLPAKEYTWITKPEFWGYFCDYDWVIFCQLFGTMVELPKGFPYYCNDLKQLMKAYNIDKSLDELVGEKSVHNAYLDAKQIMKGYNLVMLG